MSFNALSFYRKRDGSYHRRAAAPLLMFFAVLIVIAPLLISPAANAEVVDYDGISGLQILPSWVGVGSNYTNSLFPGTETAPLSSDNSVTIDYPTGGGATDANFVFGGLSQLEDATNNEVKLIDGKVNYDVYGGWSYRGNADSNIVDISGGSVSRDVYGGRSFLGNADSNTVTISGGAVSRDVLGGFSDRGNADSNTVTISGGSVGQDVYGGWTGGGGNANSNTVTISGGSVSGGIYGGRSYQGNADSNNVTISGGTVSRDVYGGSSGQGNANSNEVTISGGTAGGIYGGLSDQGNADSNTVTISGGTVSQDVYGGRSYRGNANSNTVTISGGTVSRDVLGGYSGLGNADSNTVTISGGTVSYDVYGGWSDQGNADSNTVTLSGGSVGEDVYGGLSVQGNADSNEVTISGGTIRLDVIGGYSNTRGNANSNTVTISGGSVSRDVYGGWSSRGNADSNAVTISGGTVEFSVRGGRSRDGNADSNEVTISGGSVDGYVSGGWSFFGNADSNDVTISGGTVSGDVYGGYSNLLGNADSNTVTISGGSVGGGVRGGDSGNGNADSNTVTISGGSVGEDVNGGWSLLGDAINNTVTIMGSPTLTTARILGGYNDSGTGNAFTGNTLNFKSSNITVAGVGNFEYYNFYIPGGVAANDTMLSVTDTDGVDLTDATAQVYLQGRTLLQAGDAVSLIHSDAGVSNYSGNSSSTAWLGAFLTYDFNIYADTDDLWAEVASVKVSSSNKALTNSRSTPLALINQGADLAASLEHLEVSGDKKLTAFAVFGGGSSTYSTGSDVDIDSFSLLAGVTWNAPLKKNSLALSAFIEAGWGSYDTTNELSSGTVRGDGDTDYYGAGLHMRYKWDSDTSGGLYAEGVLRFGRVSTDFNSRDMITGTGFSYDSDSNYYGVSAGLGYVWQLSDKTRLDLSGKYLWTHLDSDETTAFNGDQISFDSANSHRLRAGFRFYHDYGNANAVTLYYGAAYEYEFDGDADGRLYGTYALDGSSLSGGSGIGEVGVTFRPSKDNDRLTMQLGVQGYVGVREGISGTLKLQYAF